MTKREWEALLTAQCDLAQRVIQLRKDVFDIEETESGCLAFAWKLEHLYSNPTLAIAWQIESHYQVKP